MRAWYAEIGRRGGQKSRRVLTAEDQRKMQEGRERAREERERKKGGRKRGI